jgi:TonB family protein
VELSGAGGITNVKVLRSGGGFDEPAIDAVKQWRFLGPKVAGPSRHFAYVILGFREPVVGRTPRN